jgi:hypothetical protein
VECVVDKIFDVINKMDETKEEKWIIPDPFQLFLYEDAGKIWNKAFPTLKIDKSRVMNALLRIPLTETVNDNQILVEFANFNTTCWDLVTLTILVAYQLMIGQRPSHPTTTKPFTLSTVALIGMAYSLIGNPDLNIPKPDLDKIFATLRYDPIFEDLKDVLSDPRPFFTEHICKWSKKLYTNSPACDYKSLEEFISDEKYNQDLFDQVQMIQQSVVSRQNVWKRWNRLTELSMDQYWENARLNTSLLQSVTKVMEWLGGDILSDNVCYGTQTYNKSTKRYELSILEKMPELQTAMNNCTLSLFMQYILEYVVKPTLPDSPVPVPENSMMYTIGLAAFILAYKALALDDTKGCVVTLPLPILLSKCPGCDEEDLKSIEIDMYSLVQQTPCKEQFEAFTKMQKAQDVLSPAIPLNFLDANLKKKKIIESTVQST